MRTEKNNSEQQSFLIVSFKGQETKNATHIVFAAQPDHKDTFKAIDTRRQQLEMQLKNLSIQKLSGEDPHIPTVKETEKTKNRKKRGRRRSIREQKDIQQHHDTLRENAYLKESSELQKRIDILEGRRLGVIDITRNNEKIIINGENELSGDDKLWWERVAKDQQLIEIAQESPYDFQDIRRGFDIRLSINRGEKDSKAFSELIQEVGMDNNTVIEQLVKFTEELG